jgi:hypothetical protein
LRVVDFVVGEGRHVEDSMEASERDRVRGGGLLR